MLYSFMHPHTFTILFSVAMLVHLGTLQKSFLDTWCSRRRTWNQMKNLSLPTIFSLYRLTVFVIPFKTILRTSIVWYSASLGRSILINCTWSLYGKHHAHAGFAQLSTLIQCIYLISHVIELLRQCLQVYTFVKSFTVFSVKLMVRILLRWTSWSQTAIPVVHWLFAVAVYIEKWDHYRPHHCKFTCSNHMDTYAHENLRITNFRTNAFIELVIPILIGYCSYSLHHCIYLTEGHMTVISGPPWKTANKWLIGHGTLYLEGMYVPMHPHWEYLQMQACLYCAQMFSIR